LKEKKLTKVPESQIRFGEYPVAIHCEAVFGKKKGTFVQNVLDDGSHL
jgi:hypothetical protein